jgi:hypothetical protein
MDMVLDEAGCTTLRREVQRQRSSLPSTVGNTAKTDSTTPAVASDLAPQELHHVDAARHMADLQDRVVRDHLRPEDVRRQIMLIDGVLGLIARKVKDGDLRVRVSDIPNLLKARALLTGTPGEMLATHNAQPTQVHQHQHLHLVESARMQDARETGDQGQVLDAMATEVEELSVILKAIPRPVGGDL